MRMCDHLSIMIARNCRRSVVRELEEGSETTRDFLSLSATWKPSLVHRLSVARPQV